MNKKYIITKIANSARTIVDDINIKREGIHPVKWMHGERFYTLDETYSELKKWAEEEAIYDQNGIEGAGYYYNNGMPAYLTEYPDTYYADGMTFHVQAWEELEEEEKWAIIGQMVYTIYDLENLLNSVPELDWCNVEKIADNMGWLTEWEGKEERDLVRCENVILYLTGVESHPYRIKYAD